MVSRCLTNARTKTLFPCTYTVCSAFEVQLCTLSACAASMHYAARVLCAVETRAHLVIHSMLSRHSGVVHCDLRLCNPERAEQAARSGPCYPAVPLVAEAAVQNCLLKAHKAANMYRCTRLILFVACAHVFEYNLGP